jgi:hypothetical protein
VPNATALSQSAAVADRSRFVVPGFGCLKRLFIDEHIVNIKGLITNLFASGFDFTKRLSGGGRNSASISGVTNATARARVSGVELPTEVLIVVSSVGKADQSGRRNDVTINRLLVDFQRRDHDLSESQLGQTSNASGVDVFAETSPSSSRHAHRARFAGSVQRELSPNGLVSASTRTNGSLEQSSAFSDETDLSVIGRIKSAANTSSSAKEGIRSSVNNNSSETVTRARTLSADSSLSGVIHPVDASSRGNAVDSLDTSEDLEVIGSVVVRRTRGTTVSVSATVSTAVSATASVIVIVVVIRALAASNDQSASDQSEKCEKSNLVHSCCCYEKLSC